MPHLDGERTPFTLKKNDKKEKKKRQKETGKEMMISLQINTEMRRKEKSQKVFPDNLPLDPHGHATCTLHLDPSLPQRKRERMDTLKF